MEQATTFHPYWFYDNGRWMVATPIDFELPENRIVEIYTKGEGYKRMRLATEPSKTEVGRNNEPVLLWGKSDIESAHGKRIARSGHRKGIMK